MTAFQEQLEAMGTALLMIAKLEQGTVWALECTNDDDADTPSTLNIFTVSSKWDGLRASLKLGRPVDRSTKEVGEQFLSFRQGTLMISLIEEE